MSAFLKLVVWPWLKSIPLWVWLLLAAALGVYAFGQWMQASGRAEVQAKFDAHLSADRGAEAVAKQRARAEEERQRLAFTSIGAQHQEDLKDAIAKERAVADGLRRGALRLRKQWTCPAGDLPEAAGSAEGADALADLRAADSGRLVRIGAEADAQVKGLQAVLDAERAKPIAP
jgi:hypothetical protein